MVSPFLPQGAFVFRFVVALIGSSGEFPGQPFGHNGDSSKDADKLLAVVSSPYVLVVDVLFHGIPPYLKAHWFPSFTTHWTDQAALVENQRSFLGEISDRHL